MKRKLSNVCMKCGRVFEEHEVICWECGGEGCRRCRNLGVLLEDLLCEKCYKEYYKERNNKKEKQ